MLRTGLTAGFWAGALWARATADIAARAKVARPMVGQGERVRMGANVAPVFRQNRGKIDAISDPNSRACSHPVIGVSGEELLGAVDLFGQHRPSEQMGPGHGTEGDHQGGPFQQGFGVALGAPDQEGDV